MNKKMVIKKMEDIEVSYRDPEDTDYEALKNYIQEGEGKMITKKYLKDRQYKKADYLSTRINLHNKYGRNNYHRWFFKQWKVDPNKSYKILEVGAGTGEFWKQNEAMKNGTVTLTDFSEAMVEVMKKRLSKLENVSFKVIDVENLPYKNNTFDIVMAHHMIYHVDSIDKCLSEIKRVVKSDGFISITTNGEEHMRNVFDIGLMLSNDFPKDRHIDKFTVEVARKILPKYFDVEEMQMRDNLLVTNPEDVTGFIRSEIEARNTGINNEFYEMYTQEIKKRSKPYFIIPRVSSIFICRKVKDKLEGDK